jgi:hypothetical protein
MVPDLALRLQSMTRAMTEVVIPGIDPTRKLALEQAHLVVAYLGLLSDQHDKTFQYELAELRDARDLLTRLLARAQGVADAEIVRRAERCLLESGSIASLDVPTQARMTALVREIKSAADALVQSAYEQGDAATRTGVTQAVMDQAERQIRRERVWSRRAGFEIEPDKLPSLQEVLAAGTGSDDA